MNGRRTRLLARTAIGRLFENDLFSSSVSASAGMMWLLAALATPGVMVSGSQYYFYAHARTFAPELQDRILFVSQAFHVDFAMAIAGLITMLVWTALTPDRLDALVLGPLPVSPGEQARARLLALSRFFVMFAAAVAVPTAVAFTFVTVGDSSVTEVPRRIAGHIGSTMLSAALVFFLLIDVQLLLAALLGPRAVAIATVPLQAAALAGMVGALSFTPRLADALLVEQPVTSAWVMWNPVAWFVGVYRWVAGDGRDVFATLAVRAALATASVVGLAVIAYPIAYERCLQNAIAGEGHRAGWWSGAVRRLWLQSLRPLLSTPLERGLASFIITTFASSHAHRFLIGSYIGVGVLFALPLVGRVVSGAETARSAWFSIPLGLLCWTAAAMRVAMMLPVEPAANWIFKLTEPVDKRRVLSTAVTVIEGATACPLALFFGVAAAMIEGSTFGLMVFAVVLLTGLTLAELLTLTLRTVPCTCTYRPGQLRLRVLWPVYLTLWLLVAYGLPSLALTSLGQLNRSMSLLTGLAGAWAAVRLWRLARARKLLSFIYEELDPAATTTIDLSSART